MLFCSEYSQWMLLGGVVRAGDRFNKCCLCTCLPSPPRYNSYKLGDICGLIRLPRPACGVRKAHMEEGRYATNLQSKQSISISDIGVWHRPLCPSKHERLVQAIPLRLCLYCSLLTATYGIGMTATHSSTLVPLHQSHYHCQLAKGSLKGLVSPLIFF